MIAAEKGRFFFKREGEMICCMAGRFECSESEFGSRDTVPLPHFEIRGVGTIVGAVEGACLAHVRAVPLRVRAAARDYGPCGRLDRQRGRRMIAVGVGYENMG